MNGDNRKLRHDRHTVSLLTDHMVFAPKYPGFVTADEFLMLVKALEKLDSF